MNGDGSLELYRQDFLTLILGKRLLDGKLSDSTEGGCCSSHARAAVSMRSAQVVSQS